ncbi:Uncharacterised protein g7927 [Pycnogonum litorale]
MYEVNKVGLKEKNRIDEEQQQTAIDDSDEAPSENKILTWLQNYIIGNVDAVDTWLDRQSSNTYVPLKAVVCVTRSAGAAVFVNNPWSGILIMAAIAIHDGWTFCLGLLGLLTALATSTALKQDKSAIRGGDITFHGFLIGIVLAATSTQSWHLPLAAPVVILSILSVYVSNGLGNLLSHWRVPALNLPFNVLTFLFLASVGSQNFHFQHKEVVPSLPYSNYSSLQWEHVFGGAVKGLGQIYGCPNLLSSVVCYIAMFICSPTLAVHAFVGSIIGSLTAVGLAAPPTEIYEGVWSYNGLLCCASLGGFFFVLTLQSHLTAVMSAIFSTLLFGALSSIGVKVGLPALAFPFVISTWIFVSVNSPRSKGLRRVDSKKLTFPEKHRADMDMATTSESNNVTV